MVGEVSMSQFSRYLFVASMDVAPEREELFNEVYNSEHCPPTSLAVPGPRSHLDCPI